jgi:hypothetical protein
VVTYTTSRSNGTRIPPMRANLFAITNQEELALTYRLLDIRSLPQGESYDKNLNQLVKALRYEMRQPVALVRTSSGHAVAIPADAPLPTLERRLMPHVAILAPRDETPVLDFARLTEETRPIALSFLQFALGAPLHLSPHLWGAARAYYSKRALGAQDARDRVDVYPGFTWSVRATGEGKLFLAVDTTVRYVDRAFLPERLGQDSPQRYLRRYCLYHFGHQWYLVQLWGVPGQSIAEQWFAMEGETELQNVFAYTQEHCQPNPPPWVRHLDPDSPAIVYRYPGSEKERYGALSLCKLAFSTEDLETTSLHRRSIQDPATRFTQIVGTVERHFQQARLGDRPIQVSTTPLATEPRRFPVPPLRFGGNRVLAVGTKAAAEATDVVSLEQLGQRRMQLVLDPAIGPLDTTPFDAQYLLLPASAPRAINEDFTAQFVDAMRRISGRQDYQASLVIYDDRNARSLFQQVEAIKRALDENGITRGYVLLVLPDHAKPDLHNYIKRTLWPNLQLQCAMASKISSHHEPVGKAGDFQPRPDRAARLASYVRYCALGMQTLNRKWPMSLATPLHYDISIGIDVLNGMAGLTFVYDRGRRIFFRNHPSRQKERLTAAQLRSILLQHLRADLADLRLQPRSIVIHRDGRTFSSELQGLRQAVQELQREGVLADDLTVGVVDIRKSTADHLRLVEGEQPEQMQNCLVGSYYLLDRTEGVVCTTGRPFRFPGTAKPLTAVVVEGALDIAWVLEDIFALSQLAFAAPDKCARLPVTVKLADDFLEPIASQADDESALYETEPTDELEGDEFGAENAIRAQAHQRSII